MVDKTEQYLKDISKELHQMNKVLGRICQAPIFSKEAEKPIRWIFEGSETVSKTNRKSTYYFKCENCYWEISREVDIGMSNMDIRNSLPDKCPFCNSKMMGMINRTI